MPNKTFKVVELVGTSDVSWDDAIKSVVADAVTSLSELRVGEVTNMDVKVDKGKIIEYRVKVKLSFKYDKE